MMELWVIQEITGLFRVLISLPFLHLSGFPILQKCIILYPD
ncbi:MAG: hypothetical protein QM220_06540 [Atribacterota bacterium]|nr:hypothetical protein [Atribacterota bacterium]MDD4765672.1 hypothetical protein [Atribacterota bacterium]MDI9597165.1 hypothetical protein [Atribacterota bacterium]